jgi:hypothetical protein
MKWLIVVIFGVACVSTVIWYEATERNLSSLQRAAIGVAALASWGLVLVLGNLAV